MRLSGTPEELRAAVIHLREMVVGGYRVGAADLKLEVVTSLHAVGVEVDDAVDAPIAIAFVGSCDGEALRQLRELTAMCERVLAVVVGCYRQQLARELGCVRIFELAATVADFLVVEFLESLLWVRFEDEVTPIEIMHGASFLADGRIADLVPRETPRTPYSARSELRIRA